MQFRLAEGGVVGFVFIRLLSDSLHSGTYQLSICHYSFQLKFPSAADTVLEICCVRVSGVVPFGGAWLVDLHVYCRRLISWPPMSTGLSIHVHADIRHSRHTAYLHRFHFKPQLLRPLVVRCFEWLKCVSWVSLSYGYCSCLA